MSLSPPFCILIYRSTCELLVLYIIYSSVCFYSPVHIVVQFFSLELVGEWQNFSILGQCFDQSEPDYVKNNFK